RIPDRSQSVRDWRPGHALRQGNRLRLSTAFRIIRTNFSRRSLRETYWGWASLAREVRMLWLPRNRAFRREVLRNFGQYLFSSPAPIAGETQERARLAVDWILRGQA